MTDVLQALAEPALLVPACLVLGLLIGSFLNVVIHRLPRMMEREWAAQCAELRGDTIPTEAPYNLSQPRSACPACSTQIRAIDNIPVLSWLWLRGRCRACGAAIPIRYPLVEAVSGLLAAYVAYRYGYSLATGGALLLTWSLLALTFIDYDTQLLPDQITLPLLWAGLLFNLGGTYTDLASAVSGAMAGYLLLWVVYWLFKLATGKEGMGYGDFKLLAALGAWLGWKMLPLIVVASSVVGALVGILLIVFAGHGRGKPIPFGPYLAAAGLFALFWGNRLTELYLRGT